MIHTYHLTGMTCEGCKASVEEKLMRLPNINRVEANLVSQSVSIYSNSSIEYSALQEVLPKKYNLTKVDPVTVANRLEVGDKSDLKKLFPLILIFIYITTASVFINFNSFTSEAFMFDFMGLFYVVFSFFKFLDYKGFPKSFKMYDPLAKKVAVYAWAYPFIETVLGVLFLTRTEITSALIVTLIISVITTIGVVNALLDKSAIKCACLGTALKLPMTKATFIENAVMISMAVFLLIKTSN